LDTVRARLAEDLPIPGLALAVAGWLHFLRGVDQAGRRYEIQDPMADRLAQQYALAEQAAQRSGEGPAAMLAWAGSMTSLAAVFGDLGQDPRFVRAVAQAAQSLRSQGVAGALAALAPSTPR
jgi:fructuronate reductase